MQFNLKRLKILVLSSALIALPALAQTTSPTNSSDSQIVLSISNELLFDRYFKPDQVKITAQNGIVTMKGTVDNLRAEQRALEIAEKIKGVRSVVDQIEVAPAKRADLDIQKDIRTALLIDATTETFEIIPTVAGGVATLIGTVDSWPEKRTAEWVAKGVKGVRDVRNNLQVKMPASRPPEEIANDIRARLKKNPWINSSISVDVKGDEAVLSGKVATLSEKRRAFGAAWISGINHVNLDGVTVDTTLPAPPPVADSTALKREDVVSAIKDALMQDPRVRSFNVDVAYQAGIATLSGQVHSLKARRAAELDAKNTQGVFQVVNRISVTSSQSRTDAEIKRDVDTLLFTDPLVDKYRISTKVEGAKVTLAGTVPTLFEKYYAEDDASRVRGVKEVDNKLKVQLSGNIQAAKSDSQLQRDLRRAIAANPLIEPDDKVNFSVQKGTVTLSGHVDNWMEGMSAVNDAFVAGAKKVENRLEGRVSPVPVVSFTARPVEVYTSYWVTELPWSDQPGEVVNEQGTVSGATQSRDNSKPQSGK